MGSLPTISNHSISIPMRNLTATLCLTLAVLVGSAGVSASADYQNGLDAARSGNFATALREWEPLAAKGHAGAQYNLGLMHANGQGVPQDYKTAVKWYRRAAEQGDIHAQYNLGVMFSDGIGISQNYKNALKWYRRAAEQGYPAAHFNLGEMYRNGWGVAQDFKTAVKWYRLPAERGYAYAQTNLGLDVCPTDGGVQQDF